MTNPISLRPVGRSLAAIAAALAICAAGPPTDAHASTAADPVPVPSTAPLSAAERALLNRKLALLEGGSPVQPLTISHIVKRIPLVEQRQATSYWCVPAATRAILSRYLPATRLPSQAILAKKMRTTKAAGTNFSIADETLNNYLARPFYVAETSTSSAAGLWRRSLQDLGSPSAPMMNRFLFGWMPWRQTREVSGHATVIRGYFYDARDPQTTRTLIFWDPWDSRTYSASLGKSWDSLNWAGRWLVW